MNPFTRIIVCFVVMILCIIGASFVIEQGYRQGQIEAINGIIKYELTTKPDNSIVWVKKDGGK